VRNRPGFHSCRLRPDLLGAQPEDWRSYIELYAPSLPDTGEVVSIADRYFLSMGAHAVHTHLLMDRNSPEPLTVQKSLTAAALIAFAIDAPVVPKHSEKSDAYASPDIQGFQQELSAAGIRSTEDYFNAVAAAADLVAIFIEMPFPPRSFVTRLIPEATNRTWACFAWPASAATWRALTAYWSATLSVNLPARILNFWRAVEAATVKTQRYEIHRQRIYCRPAQASSTRALRTLRLKACAS
jgi:hypothetical protein